MTNRYQISEAFQGSCKANIGLNRYGRIHVVEDNIDIVGENYNGQLVDFTIEDNCYVNDKFIGTTVAKKITVNILNPNNEINLENKTIEVYVGIELDGILEEIPYGKYIIEKPDNEEVKEKTTFTGYDYMIKFNPTYKDMVQYPIKLSALFENLCDQVGLETGNIDFINADYMVLGNPFTNNEDCRTVLSNIAQLAGGFAKIGRDNKVYIISLKKQDEFTEEITADNYFEDFSKNNYWGELNSIVIGLSDIEGENTVRDDKESIEKNGLTEITIEDNYFLINEDEREKVIEPLWENLKGIKYLPFQTKYYGYPYIDSGDKIELKDKNDISYVSYIFNHTFKYTGAFEGEIKTLATSKAQNAYKNNKSLKKDFKNAERIINKIEGQIVDIIEEQTEHEKTLVEVIQDLEGIKQEIKNIVDFTQEKTQLENLYLNDIAVGEGYVLDFTIYGNTELFNTNEITIVASTNPRGFGENIYLTTENQEEILTEDSQQIIVGSTSFEIKSIKLKLDDVLRSLTINDETYFDTLNIGTDGTITIIRKIGVNESGKLYLLENEEQTILEEKFVLPSESETYYFIKEIGRIKLLCKLYYR